MLIVISPMLLIVIPLAVLLQLLIFLTSIGYWLWNHEWIGCWVWNVP